MLVSSSPVERDTLVLCRNQDDEVVRGEVSRLGLHSVHFNVFTPTGLVFLSGKLKAFEIYLNGRLVYSGEAVLNGLVNTGAVLVCEAGLQKDGWKDEGGNRQFAAWLEDEFGHVLAQWKRIDEILPEYKMLMADVQSYLVEIKRWLDQAQLELSNRSSKEVEPYELDLLDQAELLVRDPLNSIFDRFHSVASSVPQEAEAAHRAFCRKMLHPLLLAAPIAWRSYQKPLGYAGDYKMIRMIIEEHDLGPTVYGKLIHRSIVTQRPGVAYQNRLVFLKSVLQEETIRVMGEGRKCRILDLGCGPAIEVRRFVEECEVSQNAELCLLDFDAETIEAAKETLLSAAQRAGHDLHISYLHRSVLDLIGDRPEVSLDDDSWDLVYCVGLFDYFSHRTCERLLSSFYRKLCPGGRLVIGNFHTSNPFGKFMDHALDWQLVYRTEDSVSNLAAGLPHEAEIKVHSDATGVQVYLETRRTA